MTLPDMTLPDVATLISQYGYWIVFFGTLAEGEAILIAAGYAAHLGYLDFHWVCVCAFCGTFLSDQTIFHFGRHLGRPFLAKRPKLRRRTERALKLLERYSYGFILAFRFLYGMRTASPFAIGLSSVPYVRFLLLNIISASAWAVAIGSVGYLFGQAIQATLGKVKHYELFFMLGILVIGAIIWLFARRRRNG